MQPLQPKKVPGNAEKTAAGGAGRISGFTPMLAVLQNQARQQGHGKAAANTPAGCSQKVQTVEEDGVVKKIIVTCSCGEVTEIHCDYGDG
jgi:hypothetical protein